MHTTFWSDNFKRKDCLGDLGVDIDIYLEETTAVKTSNPTNMYVD
jgi:hypothetical protein